MNRCRQRACNELVCVICCHRVLYTSRVSVGVVASRVVYGVSRTSRGVPCMYEGEINRPDASPCSSLWCRKTTRMVYCTRGRGMGRGPGGAGTRLHIWCKQTRLTSNHTRCNYEKIHRRRSENAPVHTVKVALRPPLLPNPLRRTTAIITADHSPWCTAVNRL